MGKKLSGKLKGDKLRGGDKLSDNKLRGGGFLSFLASLPGRIYTFIMYFALFNLMLIPFGFIFLLFVMYKFTNLVLFGTNWVINGFNDTVMVAIKGIVDALNAVEDFFNGKFF